MFGELQLTSHSTSTALPAREEVPAQMEKQRVEKKSFEKGKGTKKGFRAINASLGTEYQTTKKRKWRV